MKKVIVLGCGRVGKAICLDLAKNQIIAVADISSKNLDSLSSNNNIETIKFDISNTKELKKVLIDFDLVVCAVPGFMGYKTLKTIIEEKKDVVDISFFPENSLELKELAKENNVTAIVDAGVAPGLSNLILGHYNSKHNVNYYACYVGGLPFEKKEPFEYKAPFSPIDVIEEYTRPARLYEESKIVTKEPLTEKELIEFKKIGALEAFNTDGLRTLLYTMSHIPNMKEKTLRYPGHASKIEILKKAGFFNTQPIQTKNGETTPIDFTTEILNKDWYLKENELEFTIMKIDINSTNKNISIVLYDEYDKTSNISSMARTTGYTATACIDLLLKNTFNEKGVFPLELIGKNENCYKSIIEYLNERNVTLNLTEKKNN